jgi:hypothetical protein
MNKWATKVTLPDVDLENTNLTFVTFDRLGRFAIRQLNKHQVKQPTSYKDILNLLWLTSLTHLLSCNYNALN